MTDTPVFQIPAVRKFILFRLFFNARFYYPIFTILFLDFGLTLTQFSILNSVWAATIVACEVPSGALADIFGRKKLLVFTGAAMVVEVGLLCVVPRDIPSLLFGVFLLNRVLSGMAEAAASGADEALVYDALKSEGMEHAWGQVLETQMRVQSFGYMAAMTIGAAVYDPAMMQSVLSVFGHDVILDQNDTLRLPLVLTLMMALATLAVTMRMEDPMVGGNGHSATADDAPTVGEAFRLTLEAGRWILATPFALAVILAGMMFDHVVRMVMTLNSQYYRLIDLPEASFGVISSMLAVLGVFVPRLARRMVDRFRPATNLFLLAGVTLIGLVGMTRFVPYAGLLPVVLLVAAIYMVNFMLSNYLNRITDSTKRATVLSFKGLSYNVAYGGIGLAYAGLLSWQRHRLGAVAGGRGDDAVFVAAMHWFPLYFIIVTLLLVAVLWAVLRGQNDAVPPRPPGD